MLGFSYSNRNAITEIGFRILYVKGFVKCQHKNDHLKNLYIQLTNFSVKQEM